MVWEDDAESGWELQERKKVDKESGHILKIILNNPK